VSKKLEFEEEGELDAVQNQDNQWITLGKSIEQMKSQLKSFAVNKREISNDSTKKTPVSHRSRPSSVQRNGNNRHQREKTISGDVSANNQVKTGHIAKLVTWEKSQEIVKQQLKRTATSAQRTSRPTYNNYIANRNKLLKDKSISK